MTNFEHEIEIPIWITVRCRRKADALAAAREARERGHEVIGPM